MTNGWTIIAFLIIINIFFSVTYGFKLLRGRFKTQPPVARRPPAITGGCLCFKTQPPVTFKEIICGSILRCSKIFCEIQGWENCVAHKCACYALLPGNSFELFYVNKCVWNVRLRTNRVDRGSQIFKFWWVFYQ